MGIKKQKSYITILQKLQIVTVIIVIYITVLFLGIWKKFLLSQKNNFTIILNILIQLFLLQGFIINYYFSIVNKDIIFDIDQRDNDINYLIDKNIAKIDLEVPNYCKICKIYKHKFINHCSFCRKCVIRMDHHCVWIMGCIGFYNLKNFLSFVLFGTLSTWYTLYLQLHYLSASIFGVFKSLNLFLNVLFCVFLTPLLVFNLYLFYKKMTTLEFIFNTNSSDVSLSDYILLVFGSTKIRHILFPYNNSLMKNEQLINILFNKYI